MTKKVEEEVWENLGRLEDVLYKAAQGDAECKAAIYACCGEKAEVLLKMASRLAPPPPPAEVSPPPDPQLYFQEPESVTQRFYDAEVSRSS